MSSQSKPDPELDKFLNDVLKGNEQDIKDIVEWEIEQAEDIFNDLDSDKQGDPKVNMGDILPKIDDLVNKLWKWWQDHKDSDSDNNNPDRNVSDLPDDLLP